MVIRLRPEALRQFGFQPVNVLEAIQAAYQGATVGQAYDANRVFNVVGVLAPGIRQHPDRVGQLPLRRPDGHRHSRRSRDLDGLEPLVLPTLALRYGRFEALPADQ